MNALTNLISRHLVESLGWTLLHSLWQGALVAIALSVLLMAMRKSSSGARYAASAGAMLVLLFGVAATFAWLYNPAAELTAFAPTVSAEISASVAASGSVVVADAVVPGFAAWAQQFFGQHLPLLVLAWALGALVMLVRLLGGLVLVQRMRAHKLTAASAVWVNKLHNLRERAGITRAVQLAESALVKVPLTIGVLKPIILLPLGTLAGIPANQVEAILAHELAHIARKDYLVNLLQSLVEVLFFYHPAVWYMSACVRTEREHCADDRAIALCGDSVTFASALASIEEFTLQPPVMAMALGRKRQPLLARVKRLLGQPETEASFNEGFWSGCALVALVLAALLTLLIAKPAADATAAIPANMQQPFYTQGYVLPEVEVSYQAPAPDFTPANQPGMAAALAPASENELLASSLLLTDTTGKTSNLIIIKNKKGKIVDLYVDGHRVPKKRIPEYTAQIEQTLPDKKANRKRSNLSKEKERELINRSLAEARSGRHGGAQTYTYNYNPGDFDFDFDFDFDYGSFSMAPMPPMPPMAPMAPMGNSAEAKKEHEQAMKEYEREMAEYKKEMAEFEKEMKKLEAEMEKLGPEIERQVKEALEKAGIKPGTEAYNREMAAHARAGAKVAGQNRKRAMEQHHRDMARHAKDMERHAEDMKRHAADMERHKKDMITLNEIQTELRNDKLIGENEKNFTFRISNEGMFVNDKKQPDALFKKYEKLIKAKTGQKPGEKFDYQFNVTH